jgi:hypothetical protein
MLEQLAGVVVTVTRIDRLARSTFREVRQRNGMRHRHTIVEIFFDSASIAAM